ncbi:MAG: APC family permease [Lachnospiraceae bacterium]|nr:APC family permease [Lachnospiraceae bacterium]
MEQRKIRKKKIRLTGAILMGIGCIVGSGIFGTLPTVATEYGAGVVWALLGAAFVVVLRSLALMYTSAALPISGAQFMWATKLWHPYAGMFISASALLMPTMVSLFGVLFSMYFVPLFPGLVIDDTIAAVGLLFIFTVVAWFGNKNTVSISNVMVALLLIAILLYIVLGLPNLDAENITFGEIIRPGVGLSSLAAAIGVLTSSLSGASSVSQLADDMENPGKTVPIALALCPVLVAVIYILMAVVTIGIIPSAEVESLSQVASHFMSPTLLTFFIVGGPICGIITSLVPVALACVAMVERSADTKIFPEILGKQNRYGVAYGSLFLVMGIAIGICATGATFGVVMTVFSFCNTISELPNTLSPILAHRKYPNCCDNSSVKMNYKVARPLSVLTAVICIYLSVQMARTLDVKTVALILAVYVIGYIYFFARVTYLKRKGIDLIGELKTPYQSWEEKEASYNIGVKNDGV